MTNESHKIAREGLQLLIFSSIGAVVAFFFSTTLGFVFLAWLGFVAYFFRNPARRAPAEGVLCPADGKVIFIGRDTERDFLNKDMQRVTIFMSPVNVHVNRAPETGTLIHTRYHAGKFLAAFDQRASTENERVVNHIRTEAGDDIIFTQIAGWFARRIVSYPKIGDKLVRGQIFGLIKFGSRMDIFLPDNFKIELKMNQKVTAGETVLATKLT